MVANGYRRLIWRITSSVLTGLLRACVVAQPHPKWDERPVALVILRGRQGSGRANHFAALRDRLSPNGQLPDEILFVDNDSADVHRQDGQESRARRFRVQGLPAAFSARGGDRLAPGRFREGMLVTTSLFFVGFSSEGMHMLDNTQGEHFELSEPTPRPSTTACQNITVPIRLPAHAVPTSLRRRLRLSGADLAEQAKRLPAAPDRPHAAPVLVTGGQIITMNAAMPAAEAMLVEDGRIAWVGQLSDVPDAAEGVERLDHNGKVVVPGFVEPHMHLPPLAMMHAFSNIGPNRFDTTAQALAQLAKDAAATPASEWVVGRQFDPSLQSGPDYLTADMLDEVL